MGPVLVGQATKGYGVLVSERTCRRTGGTTAQNKQAYRYGRYWVWLWWWGVAVTSDALPRTLLPRARRHVWDPQRAPHDTAAVLV